MRKFRILLLRLIFIPIVTISLFVTPPWEPVSWADFAIEWLGYLFLVIGLGIRMWSIFYIGQRKSKELVTTGPYSICRNPLYCGTFFVAMGAGLCFENLLLAIFTLVVIVPIHLWAARAEEKHLAILFPKCYELYKKTVPAFWPTFKHYQHTEQVNVSSCSIHRATLEASLVMSIPIWGDLIELLHAKGFLPVFWVFP